MKKHLAIVVDWFGPYTLEAATKAAKGQFDSGLYMVIGKKKNQKSESKLQYIGIANDLSSRVCSSHECIELVTRERKIWLGEVVTNGVPGKKTKTTDPRLDYAEWAHAYFLPVEINEKKTSNPPDRTVTVLNRWWKTDLITPRINSVHRDWPELIDFRGIEYGANIVWATGRRRRWHPSDF
ncbi:MAG: hypothetical protein HZA22_03755 [Nitrospirae bacterium]|nr:hypothetical protein [Nitrospirota bacterium]